MSWIFLVIAGLCEVGWAVGLKYSEGFTRPVPSALTLAGMAASFWLLAQATKELPLGTAYGVWVGIGTVGAAILGSFVFKEPMSLGRALFLGLLVVALVGLKLTGARS